VKDEDRKLANRNRKRNVTEKLERRRWGYTAAAVRSRRFIGPPVFCTPPEQPNRENNPSSTSLRDRHRYNIEWSRPSGFIILLLLLCVGPVRSPPPSQKEERKTRPPFNQTKTRIIMIIIKTPYERPGAQVATADIISNVVVFLFLLSAAVMCGGGGGRTSRRYSFWPHPKCARNNVII